MSDLGVCRSCGRTFAAGLVRGQWELRRHLLPDGSVCPGSGSRPYGELRKREPTSRPAHEGERSRISNSSDSYPNWASNRARETAAADVASLQRELETALASWRRLQQEFLRPRRRAMHPKLRLELRSAEQNLTHVRARLSAAVNKLASIDRQRKRQTRPSSAERAPGPEALSEDRPRRVRGSTACHRCGAVTGTRSPSRTPHSTPWGVECEMPDATSIRAVNAGLPSLGKRR